MEVFRDETNLSASPELFDAIKDALDQSRYYVLMASPGSAASDWAGKEIRYWLATKTAASQRMVLVLTDGELRWDKDHKCYDPDRSTALNPALRHTFASDPLFVDLRDAHKAAFERASPDGTSDSNTQLRNFRRAYRHPVAKIAARIRGVDPSELEGEDLRQHRRTLRVAWGAAACLVALTVAAAYGFISARRNAGAARRDHDRAGGRAVSRRHRHPEQRPRRIARRERGVVPTCPLGARPRLAQPRRAPGDRRRVQCPARRLVGYDPSARDGERRPSRSRPPAPHRSGVSSCGTSPTPRRISSRIDRP